MGGVYVGTTISTSQDLDVITSGVFGWIRSAVRKFARDATYNIMNEQKLKKTNLQEPIGASSSLQMLQQNITDKHGYD